MKSAMMRAAIEVGFIVFLFYSNLLMGEYERSGRAHEMGLAWAVADMVTPESLIIGVGAGLIGYVVVEFLRGKL